MRSTTRSAGTLLVAALATVGMGIIAPGAGAHDAERELGLAELRRATARYHHPARAVADGFVPSHECVSDPELGGMGLHYAHFGRLADPAIRSTEPEVLIYEPRPNGTLRLVAVEWVSIDRDQDLATDDDRPSVLGVPFDGPMVHGSGTPVHYDLHAWLWKHNPAGVFSAWNSNVRCPS